MGAAGEFAHPAGVESHAQLYSVSLRRAVYRHVQPPSTIRLAPVIYSDASDAR